MRTELVCIEIKHKLKRFLVSSWYRPPGSGREADDFLENFQTVVNLMLALSPQSIFNILYYDISMIAV